MQNFFYTSLNKNVNDPFNRFSPNKHHSTRNWMLHHTIQMFCDIIKIDPESLLLVVDGGNSLFVALIDSESVAIATLWRLMTPTVVVNSLGLILLLHAY